MEGEISHLMDEPRGMGWFRLALDFALYTCVFAIFVIVSGLLACLNVVNPALRLAMALACNIGILGGGTLLVNLWRNTFGLEKIGIWPIKVDWTWLGTGLGLAVVLMPVRVGVGLLAAYLFEGGIDSVQRRSDLLLGGTSFNLIVATLGLVGAGILAPIAEELLFRGAMYSLFRRRMALWPAAIISAALFAAGHADSVAVVAASFILGVVNAWLLEKSRTLWTPILLHILNNSIAVILLQVILLLRTILPAATPPA